MQISFKVYCISLIATSQRMQSLPLSISMNQLQRMQNLPLSKKKFSLQFIQFELKPATSYSITSRIYLYVLRVNQWTMFHMKNILRRFCYQILCINYIYFYPRVKRVVYITTTQSSREFNSIVRDNVQYMQGLGFKLRTKKTKCWNFF